MAQYQTDLEDIYFNLFELLKIQDHAEGYGADELKDILIQLDKFIENEIYPTRQEGDEKGVHLTDKGVVVPECFKKANDQYYQNGWYGLGQPEELGGMPAPEALAVVANSMAIGANVAFSMYYGLSRGAMNVIKEVGTQAQKDLYIPPMMSGQWGGTMCLTEAGAGSDVGASKTTATPIEGDRYNIKGVKIFISSGENNLYENIIHMVLARTPKAPEGTKGLSLFIVPRYRINADGSSGESNDVKCTKVEEKMGIHGSATCELTFGENGKCEGFLIGKEFEGIQNMFILMNEARLLCGLQGEAQANLCYLLTEQYAKERVQFGTEINKLPDVKRMLLKMRSLSRGMRALNLYTANLFDAEKKGDKEASKEIALLTPVCKGFCTEEGFNVSVLGIQVHGGYGFCSEYGIEQFARDTKIATIYEGTTGIQANDFVLRKILKDKGETFQKLGEKISLAIKEGEASYPQEISLMKESLHDASKIVTMFAKEAQAKKMNRTLEHCCDFLMFCGNLTVAWRLLESALLAQNKLPQAQGESKQFLQSKIDDFKVFSQHVLSRNRGISSTILGFEQDLSGIEL